MIIDGESLALEDLIKIAVEKMRVELSPQSRKRVELSRKYVEKIIQNGDIIYGITTGFGKFCDVNISLQDSRNLQMNLIRSHCAGVGKYFSGEIVRAMMLLRANALAKGYSGIRYSTLQTLIDMLNKGVTPQIPSQGSLGASGDLVPLAHMVLVMIGEGDAMYKDEAMTGKEAMEKARIPLVSLEAKEGLALINGTQAMTAIGSLALIEALNLSKVADICAAMSFEALNGVLDAFDENINLVRPHRGQLNCARNLRKILNGSGYVTRQGEQKVQDAYALRCIPQVHGAVKDALGHIKKVVEIELNSATDNPLIFPDAGMVISGGNFHGEPIAINMDYLSIVMTELSNICERRIERLVNPYLNEGLPAFLIKNGGLNSGLMIAQYTAAALVSENKTLSAPASIDSIPSSANQEDHVSMGTIAARKAMKVVENTRNVLAIELLCATQAIDLRSELADGFAGLGEGTKFVHNLTRKKVLKVNKDRVLSDDIRVLGEFIKSGELVTGLEKAIGVLEM